MDVEVVPAPLRERLGPGATGGLLHLLDLAKREGKEEVIATCTERFERRLSEEIGGVRVQIAKLEASLGHGTVQMGASIRQDMVEMGASIRQETAQMGASIRQDMVEMGASIRQEMAQMGASIRQDIASGRVEILKWCFLFWIGQVLAVGTLLSVMLRLLR